MLDGADGTMVASVDVENGYNKIICSAILEAIWTALTYVALTSFSTNFYRCTHILALEAAHTSPPLTSHVVRECNKVQLKLPFCSV
eukprot:8124280-Ditylum_brightwellii.AAC.1